MLKPFTGARGSKDVAGAEPGHLQGSSMTLGPIVCVCVPALIMVSSPVKKLPVSDEYGWQPLEEQAGTAAWSSHLGLTHS